MKAGTTASKYIVFNELDTEYVDNIIFTFKSIFGSVKKIYPQNVILEYGRFNQPTKPFLTPARRTSRKPCIEAMKERFDQEVNRI